MKPVMARWLHLWLEANHVAGLGSAQVLAYITGDGAPVLDVEWEPWVVAAAEAAESDTAAAAAAAVGAAPSGGTKATAANTEITEGKLGTEIKEAADGAAAKKKSAPTPASLPSSAADVALRRLHAYAAAKIDAKAFKMLNLAADWLKIYLPHTLSKIDRVTFGLLSEREHARALAIEPHMPRSRFKARGNYWFMPDRWLCDKFRGRLS